MIVREVQYFLVALQFLTRIPVPSFEGFEREWLDRSAKYFPLVGALVGVLTAGVLIVASAFFPEPAPVAITIAAGILLTGAFHEDGLADSADGLGGGTTREQRLLIMKDSRIGNFGAITLIAMLGLKGAALLGMDPGSAAKAIVASYAGGRLATVLLVRLQSYAGDADAAKVKPLATSLRGGELVVAMAFGLFPGLLLLSAETMLIATAAAVLAVSGFAVICNRLIGGYTGDTLGAAEQIYETVFLLFAAAVVSGPG